ncbi:hypothetical protein GA0070612_1243 [Micromonospora chokoriensis]|uniref:Uncharacterized protein n=1 Tax=Micromonospora chokoriensis TaxID=356851 RepID=A0A1C4VAB7_9ACTN|nr:hypothetical protein GA0070612_1243 [Micromonospora chokoriensis]
MHPLPRAVSRETGGACGKPVWITFPPVGRCPQTSEEGLPRLSADTLFSVLCCASLVFAVVPGRVRPSFNRSSAKRPPQGCEGLADAAHRHVIHRVGIAVRTPDSATRSLPSAAGLQQSPRSGRLVHSSPRLVGVPVSVAVGARSKAGEVSPSVARLAALSAVIDTGSAKSGCPGASDTPTSANPSRSCLRGRELPATARPGQVPTGHANRAGTGTERAREPSGRGDRAGTGTERAQGPSGHTDRDWPGSESGPGVAMRKSPWDQGHVRAGGVRDGHRGIRF